MIKRTTYLQRLLQLKDQDIIKVVTGVRRCGKSFLLDVFQKELQANGVGNKQIQIFNFEAPTNDHWRHDWRGLYDHITAHLIKNKPNYVILDEVQSIVDFERLADGLFVTPGVDLYLTGSNAYFLSSQLATLLAGRYMEIKLLPFSFQEYSEFVDEKARLNHQEMMTNYLLNGGFPKAVTMFNISPESGLDYLSGVYSTVILKDILGQDGITNREALENVLRFAFDNVGNLFSPKKVADYISSNNYRIASRTVEKYLSAAVDSYILYSVNRFDIKGKQLLQTQQKYYLVDPGLRRLLLAHSDEKFDYGRVLENVVYLELIRRGNQVWVGKTPSGKEVDFVVRNRQGAIEYYQVTMTMRDEVTKQRELEPLMGIEDFNRRIVLTMDPEENSFQGIEQLNVINWLLS